MKLFHASAVPNIKTLRPFAEEGTPVVYFSVKRENTVVYLSNAIERFCKATNFQFDGKFATWGPYGFSNGILRLEEYYKNAFAETYSGATGYIYTVETDCAEPYANIPFAYISKQPVEVVHCEVVTDVYTELLRLEKEGKIILSRFEDMSEGKQNWLRKIITQQYDNPQIAADYKYFLENKFHFLKNN